MIFDKSLLFAEKLDVFGATGNSIKGDVIDLDTNDRWLGGEEELELAVVISTAFAGGASSGVQFKLSTGTAPGTSLYDVIASKAFPAGQLVAGKTISIPIPANLDVKRYLQFTVTTSGAATTAGAVSAGLVMATNKWRAVKDAQN